MKKHLVLTATILAASLLTGLIPAAAEGIPTPAASVESYKNQTYSITDKFEAQIRSVLNEKVEEGTQVGVVLQLKNMATASTKIPEFEVRVTLTDGSQYYLQSSSSNTLAARPKTKESLSYMTTLAREDDIEIAEVSLVNVDWYTFPKIETVLQTIPVKDSWKGSLSSAFDASLDKAWGDPFTIPQTDSTLVYQTTALEQQNSDQGVAYVVKILVQNPGNRKETIPGFSLNGIASSSTGEQRVYESKQVDTGSITLEGNDKKYLYYPIHVDNGFKLQHIHLLTNETFKDGSSTSTYTIGRLAIALPETNSLAAGNKYVEGTPFTFDANSHYMDPKLNISMVSLNLHENEGDGFQTAVAKFNLTNTGDLPISVPGFKSDLVNLEGYTYSGSRQNAAAPYVMPHTSYVVSYSYVVPTTEKGDHLFLKIADPIGNAAYQSAIGTYQVAVDEPVSADEIKPSLSLYPYTIKTNYWSISALTNLSASSAFTYTYKLIWDTELKHEEGIIVDTNFSQLHLELVNPGGKILSVKDIPFTGVNKLVDGKQVIYFDSLKAEQLETPLRVNLYETITTGSGVVKRYLTTFHE